LRAERQCASALRVAGFLGCHPRVKEVFTPVLASPEVQRVHERQARGPGPVVSFTTGDPDLSRRIVEAVRLFAIAVSFGSVSSTISLPCRMSHASIPAELQGSARRPTSSASPSASRTRTI
jgi:cystathionine beta-lyase